MQINHRKIILSFILSVFFSLNLFAEFHVIPMLDFGMLRIGENNHLFSPSGKMLFKYQKPEDDVSGGPDSVTVSMSYSQDIFKNGIEGYEEKQFHGFSGFGKMGFGKNTFLLKITGRGAHPFESYKNFEGLLFYSRELIKNDSTTLVFGGGLAATDTGIIIGGIDIFVVPLPMVYFSYKNPYIQTEMEWTGLPMINLTLFPENKLRIRTNASLAGFDLPVDLQYDLALCWYPLSKQPLDELVSVSAGFASNVKKFRVDMENSLKYQYYCAYGEISMTALTLRAGYAFGGKKILRINDSKITDDYNGGFYATISTMYKF